jgi:acetyl-CoA synthetase
MGAGEAVRHVDLAEVAALMGSVGEPINPEAWEWYYRVVGDQRCPIVDTWWQTETGAHADHAAAGCDALKPGSAAKPFFGDPPQLVDDKGNVLEGATAGNLCIARLVAGPDAHRLSAITSASCRPTSAPTPASISPVMAAAATRMAITGSPAASTT